MAHLQRNIHAFFIQIQPLEINVMRPNIRTATHTPFPLLLRFLVLLFGLMLELWKIKRHPNVRYSACKLQILNVSLVKMS